MQSQFLQHVQYKIQFHNFLSFTQQVYRHQLLHQSHRLNSISFSYWLQQLSLSFNWLSIIDFKQSIIQVLWLTLIDARMLYALGSLNWQLLSSLTLAYHQPIVQSLPDQIQNFWLESIQALFYKQACLYLFQLFENKYKAQKEITLLQCKHLVIQYYGHSCFQWQGKNLFFIFQETPMPLFYLVMQKQIIQPHKVTQPLPIIDVQLFLYKQLIFMRVLFSQGFLLRQLRIYISIPIYMFQLNQTIDFQGDHQGFYKGGKTKLSLDQQLQLNQCITQLDQFIYNQQNIAAFITQIIQIFYEPFIYIFRINLLFLLLPYPSQSQKHPQFSSLNNKTSIFHSLIYIKHS